MKVTFDAFRWMADGDGVWLCLRTTQARRACETLEPGKLHDAELRRQRKKRSLDANAYCWVLLGKLSETLRLPPEEVYRQYIPDIGGNYTVVPVREDRVEQWDKLWCGGHLGRSTVDAGPCRKLPGYRNVMSYIGSSDYDTAQMSRLIDLIVQDCKDQGIETLTPVELDRLKEDWHEK